MGYLSKEEFDFKMKKIQSKNKQIELRNKLKAEKHKSKLSKNKIKTSNIVLISAIIAVIIYTAAAMYIQYNTSVEISSTLTEKWFRFWTVEVVALAGIKVTKVFKDIFSISNDTEG